MGAGKLVLGEAGELVDLVGLIFGIAHGDAKQNFGIEELQETGGKSVAGIVNIGGPQSAVRAEQTQVRIGPLRFGSIHRAGEGLQIVPLETRCDGRVGRHGRIRSDSQVVMMGGLQRFSEFLHGFGLHGVAFQRQPKAQKRSVEGCEVVKSFKQNERNICRRCERRWLLGSRDRRGASERA